MTDAPPSRPRGLLPGLAVTETVSWGICFYGFAVLLPPMERDLGWSRATLVGAFTIAVIVSGFAAFPVGRWLDRGSARLLMTDRFGDRHRGRPRLVAVAHRPGVLRVVAADRHRHGPRALRTRPGRADQAVRSPGDLGDHHPDPGRRVRLDHLPADHRRPPRRPRLAQRADDLRRRPRRRSPSPSTPSCCPADRQPPAHASDRDRWTWPTSARSWRFVTRRCSASPIAFSLSIGAMSAAIVHLIPYLTDHGWTDLHAAIAAGLIGATQVAARVVFGLFAERVAAARLALLVLLVPVGGIVVLATSNGAATAWLAVALLGIGQGTTTLLRPSSCPGGSTPSSTGAAPPRAQRGAPSPEPSPRSCSPAPPGSAPRATRSASPSSPSSASSAPSSPTTACSSRLPCCCRHTPTPKDDGGCRQRQRP